MRLHWLLGAFVLSALLLRFHLVALEHFWYWKYPVFDIPMHMLGGLALGAFAVALSPRRRPRAYLAAMVVLFIGWELIEWYGGVTRYQANYVFDTMHDLLDDAVGAVAAYALARFTIWR